MDKLYVILCIVIIAVFGEIFIFTTSRNQVKQEVDAFCQAEGYAYSKEFGTKEYCVIPSEGIAHFVHYQEMPFNVLFGKSPVADIELYREVVEPYG